MLQPEHFIKASTAILFQNPLYQHICQASEQEAEVLEGLQQINEPQKLTGGLSEWREENGLVFH